MINLLYLTFYYLQQVGFYHFTYISALLQESPLPSAPFPRPLQPVTQTLTSEPSPLLLHDHQSPPHSPIPPEVPPAQPLNLPPAAEPNMLARGHQNQKSKIMNIRRG